MHIHTHTSMICIYTHTCKSRAFSEKALYRTACMGLRSAALSPPATFPAAKFAKAPGPGGHACVYMYVCTCMCVHVYVYMYVCTCMCVHVVMYVCTCEVMTRLLQCDAVWCSVMQCVAVRFAVCCTVMQCVAVCCSVLQCVAVCCSVVQYAHKAAGSGGEVVSVRCLHIAWGRCSHRVRWGMCLHIGFAHMSRSESWLWVLVCQPLSLGSECCYVSLWVLVLSVGLKSWRESECLLQCLCFSCNVLLCMAVCCSLSCSVLQCVKVCCSIFCSVLQYVAVCCSVLQCVHTAPGPEGHVSCVRVCAE